ncbi:MAG TPA: type II CAAX endopeptidase family protein [Acidobacteriaceae bacterium]|jgi:membrane protease YdiL (CAAX protease family)|nr:type II CAAX endopeptidase family protein [Acidobacteriaceae bacterium]
METERWSANRILKVVGFGLLAFAITVLAGGIWSALLVINLRSSPALPWSVPAMALVLWLTWSYLGGRGWPRRTSEARRRYLRANRKSGRTYLWAWVAGALCVVALAGYWIVLFQLVKMPPNLFADMSSYPQITVALMIVMGSLVSPLMEEAGFRGYFQVALEREVRGSLAIVIASILFALAHGLTQGFLWPKLLFYFLVGIAFGAIAYLTNSILPAIPVHVVALLIFFTVVWPHDAARRLVWDGGTDNWFWIHVAQAIVFSGLSVWAFQRLAKVSIQDPHVEAKAA